MLPSSSLWRSLGKVWASSWYYSRFSVANKMKSGDFDIRPDLDLICELLRSSFNRLQSTRRELSVPTTPASLRPPVRELGRGRCRICLPPAGCVLMLTFALKKNVVPSFMSVWKQHCKLPLNIKGTYTYGKINICRHQSHLFFKLTPSDIWRSVCTYSHLWPDMSQDPNHLFLWLQILTNIRKIH